MNSLVQVKGRSLHKLEAHLIEDEALHSQHQLVWPQHPQHHQLLDRGQILLPGLWQGLLSRVGAVKDGFPWSLQMLLSRHTLHRSIVYELHQLFHSWNHSWNQEAWARLRHG